MCGQQKTVGDNKKKGVALPTFSIESVFIKKAVDSHEGRGVSPFNIPGAQK